MSTTRRTFLSDFGMGFTGLALGTMLQRDGISRAAETPVWSPPDGQPHFTPKAKSVIWVFLSGGYSQLETFDPKPALNKYAGMTFQQTPFENPLESPLHDKRSRAVIEKVRDKYSKIYPLQVGFRNRKPNAHHRVLWYLVNRCPVMKFKRPGLGLRFSRLKA